MRVKSVRGTARGAEVFPSDSEIRQALVQSGMSPLRAAWATSQVMRLLRLEFGARRRRRLYDLAVSRMGLLQLKEKLVGIVTRHQQECHGPVSVDDLWQGNYKEMLVDFGPTAVDRALNELAREGIVRRDKRGIADVMRATGRQYRAPSVAGLRQVLDAMKVSLNLRYAADYDVSRTFQV
jgi:hypothetical protein